VIAFALIATAMVAVAVAWILVPLLRGRGAGDVDRDASNVAILRDQLAELQADLARGAISPEQFEPAKRELERRVLDEVSATPGAAALHRGTPWAAAVLAGLVPVVAVLLYLVIGTPGRSTAGEGPRGRAGTRSRASRSRRWSPTSRRGSSWSPTTSTAGWCWRGRTRS
jgi:cytochrome c-type biogenesis protein CcmH